MSKPSFRERTLSQFQNTLPPAIRLLSALSIIVGFIAFVISVSHLGKWNNRFTIIAFPITFAYWAIFAMRSSSRYSPKSSDGKGTHTGERETPLVSQVRVFRQSSPAPREGPSTSTTSATYPSYVTHFLNLITTFLLAGMWSGGPWVSIAKGMHYKKEGSDMVLFIMLMLEGAFGYTTALILWAIFGLCLRARIRRGREPVLV